MTKREKLREYMERKCARLSEYNQKILLYNKEDYDEIDRLSDEIVNFIWDKLITCPNKNPSNLCPQCVLTNMGNMGRDTCCGCQYSKRHGTCSRAGSDWGEIVLSMPNAFPMANMILEILMAVEEGE